MQRVLLIFIGAGCGGVLRYLIGSAVQHAAPGDARWFPLGTLAVNATGCFLMGLLAAVLIGEHREGWRALVLIGVLGGYTTYSSFGRDALTLYLGGRPGAAAVYVLATNLLALTGVWAGARLGGLLSPGALP
jgi:CrcB protein